MLLQAPAPQDQAGAEAVRRSRAEKALVGSAQLSAVTVSDGAEVDASSASRSQRIGGRLFVCRDGTRAGNPAGGPPPLVVGGAVIGADLAFPGARPGAQNSTA